MPSHVCSSYRVQLTVSPPSKIPSCTALRHVSQLAEMQLLMASSWLEHSLSPSGEGAEAGDGEGADRRKGWRPNRGSVWQPSETSSRSKQAVMVAAADTYPDKQYTGQNQAFETISLESSSPENIPKVIPSMPSSWQGAQTPHVFSPSGASVRRRAHPVISSVAASKKAA